MKYWILCYFTYIVLICVIKINAGKQQMDDADVEDLPSDFVKFVNGLDNMVFKNDKRINMTTQPRLQKRKQKLFREPSFRRNKEIRTTQNAVLRDMLMLKLVSYYEDKYKLALNTKTDQTPEPDRRRTLPSALTARVKTTDYEEKSPFGNEPKISKQINDLIPKAPVSDFTQDFNTLDQYSPDEPKIEEVVVL